MTDRDATSEDLPAYIAEPLRATESLNPAVAARVMETVRAEGPTRYPRIDASERRDRADATWWRRRSVQLSPMAALAWAAGLVAVASVGTLRAVASGGGGSPTQTAVAMQPVRAETVHVVRFVFRAPDARRVSLVGDFNGWAKDATPLVASGENGAWAVAVAVPRGRHEYAFIVDGTSWSPDPFATRIADEFGTESSVVTVGDTRLAADDAARKSD